MGNRTAHNLSIKNILNPNIFYSPKKNSQPNIFTKFIQLFGLPFTKAFLVILKLINSLLASKPHSKKLFQSFKAKKIHKKFTRNKHLKLFQKTRKQSHPKIPKSLSPFLTPLFHRLQRFSVCKSLSDFIFHLRHLFATRCNLNIQNITPISSFSNKISILIKPFFLPPQQKPKTSQSIIHNPKSNLPSFFSKTKQPISKILFSLSQISNSFFTPISYFAILLKTWTKNIFTTPFFHLPSYLTKHHRLRIIHLAVPVFVSIIFLSSYIFYTEIIKDLPNPITLATNKPRLTTKIYDRNHQLLYKIYRNENRTLVPLDHLPKHIKQATIAIEDQNFYQHPGVSIRGIIRAFKATTFQDRLEGGSTLTQQLIKNTLLTPERTLKRKIKEALLSIATEFYFSKDQILSMYLNQVPYGGTAYGIEEASQMYFGKNAKDLDLPESAFLAGLPQAPTHYSPYGTNPQRAKQRQIQVLRRMIEDGYITKQEALEAANQKLDLKPHHLSLKAPHFVMYVKDLLAQEFGAQTLEQGGLEVYTSIDLELQQKVQTVVTTEVESLKHLNVSNGAALVTNPKTGEILAMVGSVDYFDTDNDGQVNVTVRPRQPGSSIKPINYAAALESGLTPVSLILDAPTCFHIKGQEPYCPKNYDGRFHGQVTIRKALANSYNIPAVKTLNHIGVSAMLEKGKQLGITTWQDTSRFWLALTLGGGEVKMTDMAVVYGTFANAGTKVPLKPITQVTTNQNQTYEICDQPSTLYPLPSSPQPCPQPEKVLDPRVAYQITNILSDNLARSQAFGTHSVLHIPGQEVAVKTGTTNNMRDNWTIGYTQDHLVATWVGNNDNQPMSQIASGITGASPIWNKIINLLLDPQTPHYFEPPANLVKVRVCPTTGTLACDHCQNIEEYFIPGTQPKYHCSTQQVAGLQSTTTN